FQNIDSIESKNVRSANTYAYTDHSPIQGRSFYCVVFRHADNRYTSSDVLPAMINSNTFQPKILPGVSGNDCVILLPDLFVEEVSVLTITGNLIYRQTIGRQTSRLKISTAMLRTSGTYIMQVVSAGRTYNLRISKIL
ncbi:MAG: hypothetical protein WCF67_12575, partial [Chitinophagaceae bacterium]